ncbi:MAG: hypothetical protein L0216_14390, partial [Planctomycetales bacterium]|nr:hypothetical protein [Planctomycetales bacterium]
MSPRARAAAVAGGFLALPFLLAPGLLLGETPWLREVWSHEFPTKELVARAIAAGRWPLWNPMAACGTPVLAAPEVGALYPLNPLLAALPYDVAFPLFLALHVALAGLAARALALGMGTSAWGAALAGLAYAASGPVVSALNVPTRLEAAAWIPLALLGGRRFAVEGRPAALAGGAGALAMVVLAGEAQFALYVGGALLLWILADTGSGGSAWARRAGSAAGRALAVGALAAGLAAIQIFPAMEWMAETPRGGPVRWDPAGSPGSAAAWSWRPWELGADLLVPDLVGCPTRAFYGSWFGLDPRIFAHAYAGLLVLALAGKAGARPGGPDRAALAWVAAGFLLACGRHLPVYGLLYDLVPFFDRFRYPGKATPFLALGLAVLAGRGLDRWRAGPQARARPDGTDGLVALGAGGFAAAALLLAAAAPLLFVPDAPPEVARAVVAEARAAAFRAAALALLAGAALVAARPGRLPGAWGP